VRHFDSPDVLESGVLAQTSIRCDLGKRLILDDAFNNSIRFLLV